MKWQRFCLRNDFQTYSDPWIILPSRHRLKSDRGLPPLWSPPSISPCVRAQGPETGDAPSPAPTQLSVWESGPPLGDLRRAQGYQRMPLFLTYTSYWRTNLDIFKVRLLFMSYRFYLGWYRERKVLKASFSGSAQKRARQSETPAGACQRGKGMKLWGGLDVAPDRQPILPPGGMRWVLTTGNMVPLLSHPVYLRWDHKASWKDTIE